ncbi:MAG: hypothetical protein H6741_26765 [Alphaproteobacteria bacterium]|nr:hypothetical protein [Alphaproteobacteria bacterium]
MYPDIVAILISAALSAPVATLGAWVLLRAELKRQQDDLSGLLAQERGALFRAATAAALPDELKRQKTILLVGDDGRLVGQELADAGFLKLETWRGGTPQAIQQLREADLVVLNGHQGQASDELIELSQKRWVVVFHRGRIEGSPHLKRMAIANNELTLIDRCMTVLRVEAFKGS